MSEAPVFTLAGIQRGASDLAGAVIPVVGFGIGFGAAAAATGLTPSIALAMSGIVFAGASQYAALELWHAPLPLVGILIMTLAVNARHIVLGATLHGYLIAQPPLRRYAALALLSDANWSATQQAVATGDRDLGHLVGGGLVLWVTWLFGTSIGVIAGRSAGNLGRFGIDALMPAFFVCGLIGLVKAREDLPPWAIAGVTSGAMSMALPIEWAILIGALTGGVAGSLRDARR